LMPSAMQALFTRLGQMVFLTLGTIE